MRLFIIFSVVFLASCSITYQEGTSSTPESDLVFTATESTRKNGFPFSNIVESDGWLFMAGTLGVAPGRGLVDGGIEAETRQTMQNIKDLLASEGLGMDRVVKCTVMLVDMAEWPTFNKVYKEFFNDRYPARSAFGVSALALNARVEVECIARR